MKKLNPIVLILASFLFHYSTTSSAQCALTGEVVLSHNMTNNPENTFDHNVIYFHATDTIGNCPDAAYLVFNWSSDDLQGQPTQLWLVNDFNWYRAIYPGPGVYEVCVEVLAYDADGILIDSITSCHEIAVGCGDWTFHAFTSLRSEEQIVVETFENFAFGDFSYQWFINDVPQDISNSSSLTIDNPAYPVYVDVEVVSEFGCSRSRDLDYEEPIPLCDFDFVFEVVDNQVFVHEVFEGQVVSLSYPNPHYVTYLTHYNALFDYTESGAEFTFHELGVYEVCASIENSTCIYSECIEVEITNIPSGCEAIIDANNNGYNYMLNNASEGVFTDATWTINGVESTGLWSELLQAEPNSIYVVGLDISNPATGCSSSTELLIETPSGQVLCGYAYEDLNENGLMDADEPGVEDVQVLCLASSTFTDANGRFECYVHPDHFEGSLTFSNASSGHRFVDGSEYYWFIADYTEADFGDCFINIRMVPDSVTLCGIAYSDGNGNGSYDVGETVIQGVEISDVYMNQYEWPVVESTTFTNEQGAYCLNVQRGGFPYQELIGHIEINDDIIYGQLQNYNAISQAAIGATVNNINLRFNFSYLASDPKVICYNRYAAPGFQDDYVIALRNNGTEPSTVNVTLTLPAEMQCVETEAANGVQGVISSNGNVVTWNNVVLPPMSLEGITITLLPSTTTVIGSALPYSLSLDVVEGEDTNLANNTQQRYFNIVGPYDPNNKLVFPAGEGPEGQMLPTNEPFLYTINFQNIGSAPAINVVIDDPLDEDLNFGTFEVISASHDYFVTIDSDGFSRWTFPNINLPDSTTNEPESHGQVHYKIAPKLNRPVGTVFENTAYIYFDFNEAIITNTTVNTFVNSVNIPENEREVLFISPNPANEYVLISSSLLDGNATVRLLDMQGRLVLEARVTNIGQFQLPLALDAGHYVVQLHNTEKVGAIPLIVR